MTNQNDDKLRSQKIQKMEELQLELQKNPKSLSFVQLADLYIAEKMIDEAQVLIERSLKYNPHSISGLILLGRVFKTREDYQKAIECFDKALTKAPTNWHCLLLRADTFLKLQKPKKALSDFKKVLLFNPTHPLARKAIGKLEVLTADEYEDDVFEMQSVKDFAEKTHQKIDVIADNSWAVSNQKMERVLSLIDAFTVRHEYQKSISLLRECLSEFGEHPEIQTRLLRLSQYENAEKIRPKTEEKKSNSRRALIDHKKIKTLELLLRRIQKLKSPELVP
jgi:tetratricopeptide (TPR) repeat protein